MRRWFNAAGWTLGALVLLAVAVIAVGLQMYERRMHRKVDVKVAPVALRTDQQSLDRGRYLYASRGCTAYDMPPREPVAARGIRLDKSLRDGFDGVYSAGRRYTASHPALKEARECESSD